MIETMEPTQHPFHIAVQDGHPLLKTQGRNRRCGGGANARQGLQSVHISGKHATQFSHHVLGAAVQIARTAVITQTTPQPQHLVLVGLRQGVHGRKAV